MRVLVVDDSDTSRNFLGHTFAAWNWRHDAVASGMEALAMAGKLRAAGERYDAVLVDWRMPGMDGLSTMRALRGFVPGKTLPVLIMVGAFDRARLIQESATAEASAIVLKPITASSLRAAFDSTLAPQAGEGGAARAQAASEDAMRLGGVRVLLVEDNELNQFVAVGILKQAGAVVEVAGNGREALDRLARGPAFDLILMDVQMPVMDGLTATRAIRNNLGLRMPVIAMSAGVMVSERTGCMAAGMNDFIAKPLDVDEMLKVIARLLPPRSPARPGAIPGVFDADGLLALSRNNPEQRKALIGILSKLIRTAPAEMRSAREALEQGRLDDAGRTLHTLRGSVGIVHAKRFVGACLALESAIRERRHEGALSALLAEAETELDSTIAACSAWIEPHLEGGSKPVSGA